MTMTKVELELHDRYIRACRKQELVTKFSGEGDEYQKKLDKIDLWAMEIQELVKKIRANI